MNRLLFVGPIQLIGIKILMLLNIFATMVAWGPTQFTFTRTEARRGQGLMQVATHVCICTCILYFKSYYHNIIKKFLKIKAIDRSII